MRKSILVLIALASFVTAACGGATSEDNRNPFVPTPMPMPNPSPNPGPGPAPSSEIRILTEGMPDGVLGQTGYNWGLEAEGCVGECRWSVEGLPAETGFLLQEGALRAAVIRRTGRYTFTVTVEDTARNRASKELTFTSTTHLRTFLDPLTGQGMGVAFEFLEFHPVAGATIRPTIERHPWPLELMMYFARDNCMTDPENRCIRATVRLCNYTEAPKLMRFGFTASPTGPFLVTIFGNTTVYPAVPAGQCVVRQDPPTGIVKTSTLGGWTHLVAEVDGVRNSRDMGYTTARPQ